ncbi:hypothetical protein G7K_3090-t1 [Saitoella complicata NRRL Y-17804]|uniref:Transmembrane protein n=2 Tax=Saitoella complicata (strain BCRC 22490 / CBS 7301 / JCM 7358 / NBRC 10748 / NRRL Y-17804) TaxID=698492 RepID=A0A0E9NGK0_SAICN|nr:hypothetical protein G7K_3090-t1 [Saitoella complicata NRRL Y-17804]
MFYFEQLLIFVLVLALTNIIAPGFVDCFDFLSASNATVNRKAAWHIYGLTVGCVVVVTGIHVRSIEAAIYAFAESIVEFNVFWDGCLDVVYLTTMTISIELYNFSRFVSAELIPSVPLVAFLAATLKGFVGTCILVAGLAAIYVIWATWINAVQYVSSTTSLLIVKLQTFIYNLFTSQVADLAAPSVEIDNYSPVSTVVISPTTTIAVTPQVSQEALLTWATVFTYQYITAMLVATKLYVVMTLTAMSNPVKVTAELYHTANKKPLLLAAKPGSSRRRRDSISEILDVIGLSDDGTTTDSYAGLIDFSLPRNAVVMMTDINMAAAEGDNGGQGSQGPGPPPPPNVQPPRPAGVNVDASVQQSLNFQQMREISREFFASWTDMLDRITAREEREKEIVDAITHKNLAVWPKDFKREWPAFMKRVKESTLPDPKAKSKTVLAKLYQDFLHEYKEFLAMEARAADEAKEKKEEAAKKKDEAAKKNEEAGVHIPGRGTPEVRKKILTPKSRLGKMTGMPNAQANVGSTSAPTQTAPVPQPAPPVPSSSFTPVAAGVPQPPSVQPPAGVQPMQPMSERALGKLPALDYGFQAMPAPQAPPITPAQQVTPAAQWQQAPPFSAETQQQAERPAHLPTPPSSAVEGVDSTPLPPIYMDFDELVAELNKGLAEMEMEDDSMDLDLLNAATRLFVYEQMTASYMTEQMAQAPPAGPTQAPPAGPTQAPPAGPTQAPPAGPAQAPLAGRKIAIPRSKSQFQTSNVRGSASHGLPVPPPAQNIQMLPAQQQSTFPAPSTSTYPQTPYMDPCAPVQQTFGQLPTDVQTPYMDPYAPVQQTFGQLPTDMQTPYMDPCAPVQQTFGQLPTDVQTPYMDPYAPVQQTFNQLPTDMQTPYSPVYNTSDIRGQVPEQQPFFMSTTPPASTWGNRQWSTDLSGQPVQQATYTQGTFNMENLDPQLRPQQQTPFTGSATNVSQTESADLPMNENTADSDEDEGMEDDDDDDDDDEGMDDDDDDTHTVMNDEAPPTETDTDMLTAESSSAEGQLGGLNILVSALEIMQAQYGTGQQDKPRSANVDMTDIVPSVQQTELPSSDAVASPPGDIAYTPQELPAIADVPTHGPAVAAVTEQPSSISTSQETIVPAAVDDHTSDPESTVVAVSGIPMPDVHHAVMPVPEEEPRSDGAVVAEKAGTVDDLTSDPESTVVAVSGILMPDVHHAVMPVPEEEPRSDGTVVAEKLIVENLQDPEKPIRLLEPSTTTEPLVEPVQSAEQVEITGPEIAAPEPEVASAVAETAEVEIVDNETVATNTDDDEHAPVESAAAPGVQVDSLDITDAKDADADVDAKMSSSIKLTDRGIRSAPLPPISFFSRSAARGRCVPQPSVDEYVSDNIARRDHRPYKVMATYEPLVYVADVNRSRWPTKPFRRRHQPYFFQPVEQEAGPSNAAQPSNMSPANEPAVTTMPSNPASMPNEVQPEPVVQDQVQPEREAENYFPSPGSDPSDSEPDSDDEGAESNDDRSIIFPPSMIEVMWSMIEVLFVAFALPFWLEPFLDYVLVPLFEHVLIPLVKQALIALTKYAVQPALEYVLNLVAYFAVECRYFAADCRYFTLDVIEFSSEFISWFLDIVLWNPMSATWQFWTVQGNYGWNVCFFITLVWLSWRQQEWSRHRRGYVSRIDGPSAFGIGIDWYGGVAGFISLMCIPRILVEL